MAAHCSTNVRRREVCGGTAMMSGSVAGGLNRAQHSGMSASILPHGAVTRAGLLPLTQLPSVPKQYCLHYPSSAGKTTKGANAVHLYSCQSVAASVRCRPAAASAASAACLKAWMPAGLLADTSGSIAARYLHAGRRQRLDVLQQRLH